MNENITTFRQFDVGKKYKATCIKCYDGDTCTVTAHLLGDESLPLYKWSCRIFGIDTPELKTDIPEEKLAATEDKKILEDLILNKQVYVEGITQTDKYGRELVNIYTEKMELVTDVLIKKGWALPYSGGKKLDWNERKKLKGKK